MLQQTVPCLGGRDLLKGTSPQARLMSTNPGGGSLISNTNTDTNNKLSQLESDSSSFGSVRPGLKSDIGYTASHQLGCHTYGEGIPLCRVDFTHYHFYTGTNYVYLVFSFNQKHGDHVWAFLEQTKDTQRFKIYTCTSGPSGPIQITASTYIHVDCHGDSVPYAGGRTDPNIVFQNFKQDCHYFELHCVTYEQYMVSIIDKMIDQLDCSVSKANVHESVDMEVLEAVNTNSENQPNTVDIGEANFLPLKIQGNFVLALDDNMGISPSSDYSIPNKTRGFLFQESGNFQFIGPDREAIDIKTVEQCINIADIVRDNNKPNYQQARFPLNSGLNLQAWEDYLQDYPHRIVLQYLKFGFPLSIDNPDALNNTKVVNHFSALQHPPGSAAIPR